MRNGVFIGLLSFFFLRFSFQNMAQCSYVYLGMHFQMCVAHCWDSAVDHHSICSCAPFLLLRHIKYMITCSLTGLQAACIWKLHLRMQILLYSNVCGAFLLQINPACFSKYLIFNIFSFYSWTLKEAFRLIAGNFGSNSPYDTIEWDLFLIHQRLLTEKQSLGQPGRSHTNSV